MQEGLNPIITKWLNVPDRCLKRCEDKEDEISDVEIFGSDGRRFIQYKKAKRPLSGGRCKRLCLKEDKHEHYCRCVVHYLRDEDKENNLNVEIMEKTDNGVEPRQKSHVPGKVSENMDK
jgi:hypothetical protein